MNSQTHDENSGSSISPPSIEAEKIEVLDITPPAETTVRAMAIPIGKDGRVAVRDNSELIRYCKAMIDGKGVPDRFDTPTKLFAALMFVRDLKLPDTAIRQVVNVHGVMMMFGDLPLSLVQSSNEMTFFKEQWFDKKYQEISFENQNLENEVYGAVCFIGRNGNPPQSFSFTIQDATKAGQLPATKWHKQSGTKVANNDSPWVKHLRMMLRYKARSIALKSLFADKINGVGIAEYDLDIMPGERDVTETGKSIQANDINELLNRRKQAAKAEGEVDGKEEENHEGSTVGEQTGQRDGEEGSGEITN